MVWIEQGWGNVSMGIRMGNMVSANRDQELQMRGCGLGGAM